MRQGAKPSPPSGERWKLFALDGLEVDPDAERGADGGHAGPGRPGLPGRPRCSHREVLARQFHGGPERGPWAASRVGTGAEVGQVQVNDPGLVCFLTADAGA
ncbi:hypothetical protein SBD_5789 [Streptomyces bottropensis ATCC 25435]|uniref:Uncharacterized protein n=1 Tax=Streptomyces bottropensis ATCC 25435 TaxID=1054862 RepID=M3EUC1_9ACTN|nr:hypothetical protein SBD_5789 [Streptomyces bottropensis ATCC 25435]